MRKNNWTGTPQDTRARTGSTRSMARAARRLALLGSATLVAGGVMASAAHAQDPCGSNGVFSTDGTSRSCTYTTAGEDTFTVPTGVTLDVVAIGGRGGDSITTGLGGTFGLPGGMGARVEGSLTDRAGTLHVVVGANGTDFASRPCGGTVIGGGGESTCQLANGVSLTLNAGSGGGASDVRTAPVEASSLTASSSTDSRVLVAAGGGGSTQGIFPAAGGDAGSTLVTGPGSGGDVTCSETGRSADPGGPGGVGFGAGPGGQFFSCVLGGVAGRAGSPGLGGAGAPWSSDESAAETGSGGGGGGGGGWVGGGGGARTIGSSGGGGGGAGSSYGPEGTIYQSAGSQQPAVTITWTDSSDATAPTVTIATPPDGETYTLGASVLADYVCADETALAACVGTTADGVAVADGDLLDTSTLGSKALTVTATDDAGNVRTVTHTYFVEDSTAPVAPEVTGSDPASPDNDNSPSIKGRAEAGSTVRLYTDATCTNSVGVEGSAEDFASPGLAVSVADDSSTTFYTTATDAADNTSDCSSGFTYVEDSTAPSAPEVTDSHPDSPANDNTPYIEGTAEADTWEVRLYTNATCSSDPVVGTRVDFTGFGIVVSVPDDSSTTFYATATDDAGNTSDCSSAGLTYVEDSTPPDTVIDSGPAEGSKTAATTATFTFHATESGSTLNCQLDGGQVETCDSGAKTYMGLDSGSHTFSVVATDAAGTPDPSAATRTWTINTPPVAVDDAYAVIGGATLTVDAPGVLGNDSDADHDPLTAQLVGDPPAGLMLHQDGSLTYTPGEDTAGATVTFTYRASDGTATSNLATVTITVTAGCDGVRATRVGTAGNDTLRGTRGDDVIVALGGNDTIDIGLGNDRACGGSGNDTIGLGEGNDRGFGGTGTDTITGGAGDDTLRGNDGNDVLDGGGDRDELFGDAGVDRLLGGGDNDALDGGSGTPDRCDGEGGTDTATACEQLVNVP